MAAEGVGQIVRPIDERRQRGRRRQTEADRRRRLQAPALDHGVGEVRGADHDPGDLRRRGAGGLEHVAQRGGDAAGDILGRRRLDLGDDRACRP